MKKQASTSIPKIDQTPSDKEMSKYGISRVPMEDQYQLGKYRYTSLEHAISQAKRQADDKKR